jgi:Trk-type K+ transport system membrane component
MRGIFFWRSFTNWIGGMGVLVFVLAIMPQQDMKSSRLVHVMRAEMPGPKVDKIVATVRKTAAIMYTIYVVMTATQVVLLLFGGMDLYESLCTSFSTAGTGGFSVWADSMVSYGGTVAHPDFCTWVIAIFMFLFSINFNLYFLILTGKVAAALFSEELRWFCGIVLVATAIITANIYSTVGNLSDSIRHAFFQVSTVVSTTGFATADFNLWPNISKTLLLILMFIGACAGLAGICHTMQARICMPTDLMGSEMLCIAAVVLGGTNIAGGRGTVIGTTLGLALITVARSSLTLVGVDSSWQQMIVGIVIVAGTALSAYKELRSSRKIAKILED